MVYILLGDGFEEAEALVPADLLRRAGAKVSLVGVTGKNVTGGHGITVVSDISVEEADADSMEMLVIPGGLGGVENVGKCPAAMALVEKAAEKKGCILAAICAAPSILGGLGLLQGKKAVCYPGMEDTMTGAIPQKGCSAVVDGEIITGEGPGAAFAFGFKLVEALKGAGIAKQVAHDACWR